MLLEYEAKLILKKYDLAVPTSHLLAHGSPAKGAYPLVLKSQVPTGGRGKLGGIKIVNDEHEYIESLEQLFALTIKEHLPSSILAEELIDIDKELYLSILVDRSEAAIKLIAHSEGGIEVEDHQNESFFSATIHDGINYESLGQKLADYYNLPEKTFLLQDMIEKLVHCFNENDATLIEINPLVLTKDERLVAADCKMILDQSAVFRHGDWDFEHESQNNNFVTLDNNGHVATIANGAGLAMATVDEIAAGGLSVANFLDIGGGANEASVLRSFDKIMKYPSVSAIVINIFAGITRCDEVARAIIGAKQKITELPLLYIRLAGTNSTEANKLLDNANIAYFDSLPECVTAIKADLK